MPLQYPYFPTPGLEQTDEMKRQALAQALMQFGQQMVQPAQGKNQLHQLLTAIPGSVNAGMQGYQKSLLGEMGKQQEATQTDLYKTHADINRMSMEEKQSEMQQKKIENEWLKSLPDAVISTEGNIPEAGYKENKLAEHAAVNSNLPATVYRKHPKLLLKWLEGNIEKTKGLMVTFPGIEQPVSLSEALQLKTLYKSENDKDDDLSPFRLFKNTMKDKGWSNEQIDQEWQKRQERMRTIAPPIIVNVPGYQTPEGQPINLNLRSGVMQPAKGGTIIQPKPSEADVIFGRTFTSVIALIDGLEQKFKSIEPHMAKNAGERVMKAPLLKGQQFLQTNADIASTNAFSEATLSKIIRALGEVGTLTDRDVNRARMAIPQITDTIPVKDQKLKQLRGLVTEIYERGKRQPNVLQNPSLKKSPQKGSTTKSGNRFTIEEIP